MTIIWASPLPPPPHSISCFLELSQNAHLLDGLFCWVYPWLILFSLYLPVPGLHHVVDTSTLKSIKRCLLNQAVPWLDRLFDRRLYPGLPPPPPPPPPPLSSLTAMWSDFWNFASHWSMLWLALPFVSFLWRLYWRVPLLIYGGCIKGLCLVKLITLFFLNIVLYPGKPFTTTITIRNYQNSKPWVTK